jgi:hypothetical protein
MNEQKQPETTETDEKVCSIEYFCELCGFYPLMPIHGHYECPQCHYKTKYCEGMAL